MILKLTPLAAQILYITTKVRKTYENQPGSRMKG